MKLFELKDGHYPNPTFNGGARLPVGREIPDVCTVGQTESINRRSEANV
jgi:hypothetical protein